MPSDQVGVTTSSPPADSTPNAGWAADERRFKVFISYSRGDSAGFAPALVRALEERGLAARLDTRDLEFGEKWQAQLKDFIRQADAIVYVVSPQSIRSRWCRWEVAEVVAQSKRLVPVVHIPVPHEELPVEIADIHLFPFTPDLPFEDRAGQLADGLQKDRTWLQEHTRLTELSHTWAMHDKSSDHLLRGKALRDAETWMAHRPGSAPLPSRAQLDFIAASQGAARRRATLGLALLAIVTAGATAGGLYAWQQKQFAQAKEQEALQAQTAERKARESEEAQRKLAEVRLLESQKALVNALAAQASVDVNRSALQSALKLALQAAEVEASYWKEGEPSLSEKLVADILGRVSYVTRFRSRDFADTLKFTFMDGAMIAYVVGREIFIVDLAKKALVLKRVLPASFSAWDIKWISPYGLLVLRDNKGAVLFLNKDGTTFSHIKFDERIVAFDYSNAAPDDDLSFAVLGTDNLYLLHPGDPDGVVAKTVPLMERGGNEYGAGLAYDKSGRYLYWSAKENHNNLIEFDIEEGTFADIAISEEAKGANALIFTNETKNRSVVLCRPCATVDAETQTTALIGRELNNLAGEAGMLLPLNVDYASRTQHILIARTADAPVLVVVSHLVSTNGLLQRPVRVVLDDKSVVARSISQCRAPDYPTGFIVCHSSGSKDVGDGLVVWALDRKHLPPVPAGFAAVAAAGKEVVSSFGAWHKLEQPFGPSPQR